MKKEKSIIKVACEDCRIIKDVNKMNTTFYGTAEGYDNKGSFHNTSINRYACDTCYRIRRLGDRIDRIEQNSKINKMLIPRKKMTPERRRYFFVEYILPIFIIALSAAVIIYIVRGI